MPLSIPLQGVLRGFDQTCNLILDECHERVYSSKAGVEQLVLGLYVIRGDNMCGDWGLGAGTGRCSLWRAELARRSTPDPASHHPLRRAVIGEVDEELDAQLDFDSLRAEPLQPVTH